MGYKNINYLKESHSKRKKIIRNRLKDFKKVSKNNKSLFSELCFCLLTPQSKAKICDKAIQNLVKTNFLFEGNEKEVKKHLVGVRFGNNKSKYIVEARELFSKNFVKKLKDFSNPLELRFWLVNNVKGIGFKEASHFMRNIGIYEDVTILDRHILKNLDKYNVIDEVPKNLSKNKYLEIEEKMKKFADKINIPIEELDLLFWSEETGEVFK